MNMRNILSHLAFFALCSFAFFGPHSVANAATLSSADPVPLFVKQSRCVSPPSLLGKTEIQKITTTSSSAEFPTPLIKPKKVIPLGCDRPFLYRGELYSADPPQVQDASTLAYFMKDAPEADRILKEYQKNRKLSQFSAYTGTIGLIFGIFATPLSRILNRKEAEKTKRFLQLAGFGLAAEGFAYSFFLLRVNDRLIPKSVDAYNQAKPEDPIELQFTTGWSF